MKNAEKNWLAKFNIISVRKEHNSTHHYFVIGPRFGCNVPQLQWPSATCCRGCQLNCSVHFILPQNPTPSPWKSVTFPLGVLQTLHKSGCSTTLFRFDGSVWLTGTVCCFNDDIPKKEIVWKMFLFNRKLEQVTTVNGKGEGKIYPRNLFFTYFDDLMLMRII